MFQNWGFLLGEIWGLILLAALLGLLAGWLIWNRSKELLGLRSDLDAKDRELRALQGRHGDLEKEFTGQKTRFAQIEQEYGDVVNARDAALVDMEAKDGRIAALETEVSGLNSRVGLLGGLEAERDDALQAKLSAQSDQASEIRRVRERDAEIAELKMALAKANSASQLVAADGGAISKLETQLDQCRATVESRDKVIEDLRAQMNDAPSRDYDGDGVIEGKDEGTKPQTLSAARGGQADDLKMIKGVGPKLEKLLHQLGFFHFDQIASWTSQEVAWVDANLEGFNGRVSRDRWIEQARILASGGTTEFAARVGDGDVYS